MTKEEIKKYPLGIFKVFWKEGGQSIASIGMLKNGDRWLAPINWTMPTEKQNTWNQIEKVTHININEESENSNEPTDLEQEQFIEYQALITNQIEVLTELYKTIDSEVLQKKIREKLLTLIDCL